MGLDSYYNNLPLPSNAVQVNGAYLERTIAGYRTWSVSGRDSMEVDVDELSNEYDDGSKYEKKKDKTRTLVIKYALFADTKSEYIAKSDKLNGVLHQESLKLIFHDEQNVYYTGVTTSIDPGEVDASGSYASGVVGEITIYCNDPHKRSTSLKSFDSYVEGGIRKVKILNTGTEEVPITFRIKHSHENGYVGIVSKEGVAEFGNIEEADGVNYKRNEVQSSLATFEALPNDTGTFYARPADHYMGGTLVSDTIGGRKVLRLDSRGTTYQYSWTGGMRTLTLPADSEGNYGAVNFYCYLNQWFETGKMGQTAESAIHFLTADNKHICGYSLYKTDMSGNTATLEFWLNGRIVDTRRFVPSNRETENPYNQGRGHSDIRKEGSKVTFYWWGTYPPFSDPGIKDLKCAKIQIACSQYGYRGVTSDQYVTRNYIRAINFQKMNVNKWRDVPNKYPTNAELVVNGDDRKLYVNGMVALNDEVKGTKYLNAYPGENVVEIHKSSFGEFSSVKAEIREAWI